MHCPEVMLLNKFWGYICCHTGADYVRTPAHIRWNPLRWEIGLGWKKYWQRPCAVVINRNGRAHRMVSNFIFRLRHPKIAREFREARRKSA